MSGQTRLDAALVERGLVRSRAQAKEALARGSVAVNGQIERKASTKVADADVVTTSEERDPYVGRAARKLLAALEAFPDFAGAVSGARAVDVGASTGGFTQVLLERGATHVVALDVGHGQLAEPVKSDPRVTDLEGLNIRDVVSRDKVDGSPFDLVVSDLSFISLTLALPHMNFLLAEAGHLVVLVKPQFEVGRERLGRTGVVTSRDQRRESLERVLATATGLSLVVHGIAWSPMVGTHGNHEYLVWLRRENQGSGLDDETLRATIDQLTGRDDT
ncbi:TlyA family RNA methyltransferase [Dermacoccus sp. 147Ba]|uniref:TlyA family RNA methyltransferase n=1 Tax=unclassified Dermacoccus TaxID=2643059 RepID=UPI000642557C|nr:MULTISPECIES: TlyA family RNA methyltransferase [unclassified Dermacoccus]KLO61819.1 hemolysin A [Dermacoccus sp. PE3]QNK51920.1 TlyA family RNA methyltransferase [Dermacoccus sp. PAMC28757]RYI23562.1 TlyA family RNA methyltransferase [Dermacoccus sp. 147Ba]